MFLWFPYPDEGTRRIPEHSQVSLAHDVVGAHDHLASSVPDPLRCRLGVVRPNVGRPGRMLIRAECLHRTGRHLAVEQHHGVAARFGAGGLLRLPSEEAAVKITGPVQIRTRDIYPNWSSGSILGHEDLLSRFCLFGRGLARRQFERTTVNLAENDTVATIQPDP